MSENENKGTGRTFTEGEAYALVADAVARETASVKSEVETLKTEKSELQTKVDVLETEKAQEKQRADVAVQELTDYKAEQEAQKAAEARKADRVAKVTEANPLLELTDERQARIAAMSDEDFEAYLTDMREVASKSTPSAPKTTEDAGDPPRNTAAFSSSPEKKTDTSPVMSLFAARHGQSA